MAFPRLKQQNKMDCGPSCLKIILSYYKVDCIMEVLRQKFPNSGFGTTFMDIATVGNEFGLKSLGLSLGFEELQYAQLPCIVPWKQNHFIVVYKINNDKVLVSDPAPGLLISYSHQEFQENWIYGTSDKNGFALFFEVTKEFKKSNSASFFWKYIWKNYISPFSDYYLLAFVGVIIGAVLSLLVPLITKALVDKGVNGRDVSFINLMLLAQLITAISSTILTSIRGWLFLHISSKANITVVTAFLRKIMRLPVSYFDSSHFGDIVQRVNDQSTIRNFLSASTFNSIFSLINLITFGAILISYNLFIFIIYLGFSLIYIIWTVLFLKKRKEFDYKLFEKNSASQTLLAQIIQGVRDIKLYNYHSTQEEKWKTVMEETFKVSKRQLKFSQYQQNGAFMIDLTKSILISYFTARLVVDRQMTLGMMLSVQYILGQLNVPMALFINFNNTLQDARISIERINEINNKAEEYQAKNGLILQNGPEDIKFSGVGFSYRIGSEKHTLDNIDFTIPSGKITAIVGTSGSGKSTLIKLLLKFYSPEKGRIEIGSHLLEHIQTDYWRSISGGVLHDGFIFNVSISENIALEKNPDSGRIIEAAKIANIHDHILSQPMEYDTIVGTEINGLSQGQKQRLLIARAIYKRPTYLMFDEATNALDAINEKEIFNNIIKMPYKKSILIITHRLDTIANADNIVVIDMGMVKEVGTHEELLKKRGTYYKLVTKQEIM